MQAITQGKTPSFPLQSDDTLDAIVIRDMLEQLCRQCWAQDTARRPTMHDIVCDLRLEKLFIQEDEITMHLPHDSEVSKLERAL